MDGVNEVQVHAKDLAATIRKAVGDGEEFVLFDGDVPLHRCVPVAKALEKSAAFFVHQPHDPSECLNTCWRHDPKVQAEAAAQTEAEADADALVGAR